MKHQGQMVSEKMSIRMSDLAFSVGYLGKTPSAVTFKFIVLAPVWWIKRHLSRLMRAVFHDRSEEDRKVAGTLQ